MGYEVFFVDICFLLGEMGGGGNHLIGLFLGSFKALFKDMLLNTSHIEIFSILCIQFVLCMGYPFMK